MMFDKLFKMVKANAVNDDAHPLIGDSSMAESNLSKRRYTRRNCDTCTSTIDNLKFPVMDWSLGGMQVAGDTRLFNVNDTVDIVLKFKLSDEILSIPHRARVVRKTCERLGLEFHPLTSAMRDDFMHVVEDYKRVNG